MIEGSDIQRAAVMEEWHLTVMALEYKQPWSCAAFVDHLGLDSDAHFDHHCLACCRIQTLLPIPVYHFDAFLVETGQQIMSSTSKLGESQRSLEFGFEAWN